MDVHYISDRTAGGHVGVTDDRKSGVKTGLNVGNGGITGAHRAIIDISISKNESRIMLIVNGLSAILV